MTTTGENPGGAPRREITHFTDREPYLKTFQRLLAEPEGLALPVLAFHGVGGVGKSALIERLGHELDGLDPRIPYAHLNVENLKTLDPARESLIRLRSDLEFGFGLSFPRFDDLLTVLLAAEGGPPASLASVSPGLKNTFDLVMGLEGIPANEIVRFLHGLASKSETARRLLAKAGGREEVLRLRERARREDPTLADELIDRFADDLAAGLPARPGKACRGVLFFDAFETLWKGSDEGRSVQARRLDSWLRRLAKAVMGRGVLVVVAGRDELQWAEDEADWDGAIETNLLGGLSRHDAQIYLSKRTIGPSPWTLETPLQTAILDACSGDRRPDGEASCHPFFLALCADIVDNHRAKNAGADPPTGTFTGLPGEQVAQTLADRFLKSLPNERWELWVKELSLTPSFDERAALNLDRGRHHNLGRAGWKQLGRYSFLERQPDGHFRLHKTMRDVLRTSLVDDAADVHAWFRDHWSARNEPALAFFHRWSLDPKETLNGWVEEHETAIKKLRIAAARALLDDWSEIALDGLDRQQLGDPLWASTHLQLGLAFWETPFAPRTPSLNAAIGHFEAALRVYTEADSPAAWAMTQNNLGIAYKNLPAGDRGANLRRAIDCYEAALRVRTEADSPADWAMTQNNLGVAYKNLPAGDRGANLRRAIDCYEAALRVRTEADSPADWAMTQNNLGNTYQLLPTGDRGANLRHAVACYEAALGVRTEADFPADWAETQNNLGIAYSHLPTGNREENLRHAVACYEAALGVRTEADFPADWAATQFNLGLALRKLGTLDESVRAFESAACGYESVGDQIRADKAKAEAEVSRRMQGPQADS